MLNKIITKTRIKILFVVVVSFLVVKTASPQVFLADTPKISPFFIARIKNAPYELAQLPQIWQKRLVAGLSGLNPFKRKDGISTQTEIINQNSKLPPATGQDNNQPIQPDQPKQPDQLPDQPPPPQPTASEKIAPIDIFAGVTSVTPPSNISFQPITKSVSAAEDPETGKKYIKIEAGAKYRIVGTVVINGKEYPKIEFFE